MPGTAVEVIFKLIAYFSSENFQKRSLQNQIISKYFFHQGCLTPIRVIIPEGSLLNPSDSAAVVGGNVQTSQRIVDVIFRAFRTVAASQGCMNNITFGQEDWGYYETVAGGAGAVS